MQRCSLRLPNPYPVAYPFEVFEGNCASGVLSLSNDTFADVVVNPLSKPLFFTAEFTHTTFSRLRAFTLKFLAQATMTRTNVVDCLAAVNLTIGVSSDIDDAGVNSKHIGKLNWRGFFNIASSKQKVISVGCCEVRFALACLQQFALTFTTHERDGHASIHRPDGNDRQLDLPTEDTFVVSDAPGWFEGALGFSVELVGVGSLCYATDSHLCGQAKLSTHIRINQVVQFVLTKCLVLPRHAADVVARSVCSFKRAFQSVRLFCRGLKLDLCGQFHRSNYSMIPQVLKAAEQLAPLASPGVPGLKTAVSREATS